MISEEEAYLFGFLAAARSPGGAVVHHRDREVLEEAARFLHLACERRRIPHVRLHHPEKPLHGTEEEAVLSLPPEIVEEINRPLGETFDRFRSLQPHLERGILEGCGTLCYKKSTRGIGISFTSFDPDWLGALKREIEQHHPCGPIEKTARGSYWFSLDEAATLPYAEWLYGDPNAPHSRARRRKLERVLGEMDQKRGRGPGVRKIR